MADDIISLTGVTKCFGRTPVLTGVDLAVPRGSVTGLLGKNGAGKSTLLRCLLGLARTDAGSSRVFGRDSAELGAAEKERLGYVAQQPAMQPWMTVAHIESYVSAFYPSWDQALVDRLLAQWEIPTAQRVGKLSVGQQQKLAIVLALGHRPALLVLDEPAASLDPVARRAFLTEILAAVAGGERTVLFSTHITSDLERVADRVAILKQGRIAFAGELGELKDSVKRLRVTAPNLPERFVQPWVLASERRGDAALLTVRGDAAAAEAELRGGGAEVVVEDLGLEDIFLEMHR